MKNKIIQESMILSYETALWEAEKSEATIEKYLHSVRQFAVHYAGRNIDKGLVLEYKAALRKSYAPSSAALALDRA